MKRNFNFNESENSYFCKKQDVSTKVLLIGLEEMVHAYLDETISNENVMAIFDGYNIGFTGLQYFDVYTEDMAEEDFKEKFGCDIKILEEIEKWLVIMQSKNLDIIYNKEYAGRMKKNLFERLKNMF